MRTENHSMQTMLVCSKVTVRSVKLPNF